MLEEWRVAKAVPLFKIGSRDHHAIIGWCVHISGREAIRKDY